MTSTEVERLVEDGEVAPDLPGEWGANYWRSPDNATEITLPELGGLLRDITAGKQRREQELTSMWWWLGDLLNYGLDRHGEAFSQLVDGSDYHEESFHSAARICEAFPPDRRRQPHEASFWDHGTVKTLRPEVADNLLQRFADRLKPEEEQHGHEEPDKRTIQGRVDLRQEAKAQRMLGGGQDSEQDDMPELVECPHCLGLARVTTAAREQYYELLERWGDG